MTERKFRKVERYCNAVKNDTLDEYYKYRKENKYKKRRKTVDFGRFRKRKKAA